MKKFVLKKGRDGKMSRCATKEFVEATANAVQFTPSLTRRLKDNKGLPDICPGKNGKKVEILCAAMATAVFSRFKREIK